MKEKNRTRETQRKPWQKAGSILSTLLVLLVVGTALLLLIPRLLGLSPFTVTSSSMANVYPVGSIVFVQKVEPQAIAYGDPITFVYNSAGQIVTHRVVQIDQANGYFTTKGDENRTADQRKVSFENLIGRPVFSVPLLGFLSVFISTSMGRMIVVGSLIVIITLLYIVPAVRNSRQKKSNTQGGESNELF